MENLRLPLWAGFFIVVWLLAGQWSSDYATKTEQPTKATAQTQQNKPTAQTSKTALELSNSLPTLPDELSSRPSQPPDSQPVSQPASHPASQPAIQPASQPANQPASPASPANPASQPTNQPPTHPANQPPPGEGECFLPYEMATKTGGPAVRWTCFKNMVFYRVFGVA